jgi:uncharacterized protein YfkK (UPF0435 family)
MSELKLNMNDVNLIENEDGFSVEIDDTTDTFKLIMKVGLEIDSSFSEEQAFEAGLTKLLEQATDSI